jgi:hypothetical protein
VTALENVRLGPLRAGCRLRPPCVPDRSAAPPAPLRPIRIVHGASLPCQSAAPRQPRATPCTGPLQGPSDQGAVRRAGRARAESVLRGARRTARRRKRTRSMVRRVMKKRRRTRRKRTRRMTRSAAAVTTKVRPAPAARCRAEHRTAERSAAPFVGDIVNYNFKLRWGRAWLKVGAALARAQGKHSVTMTMREGTRQRRGYVGGQAASPRHEHHTHSASQARGACAASLRPLRCAPNLCLCLFEQVRPLHDLRPDCRHSSLPLRAECVTVPQRCR